MKFCRIVSSVVCMAFLLSSASVLENIVADAVNIKNVATVSATDSGTLESGLEYEVYEDHVVITDCDTSAEGEMIIPDTIQELPVTGIGSFAFSFCSSLTSIAIPDGVTEIGSGAFVNCSALEAITIPDGVVTIEDSVFFYCSSLKSIIIPDSVVSIEEDAFCNCSSLESIEIPDNVKNIGDKAFRECSKLQSVVIPNGVTNIKFCTFFKCSSLKSIIISDSVTSIGAYAFFECSSLTSVTISNNVTIIDAYVFEHCSSLTSITIPNSVINIERSAFQDCSSLTSVTLPNSVINIEENAFQDCSSLKSIKIQNPECKIYNEDSYNNDTTISDTAVIYGYPGSTAQEYAERYNREFVALDENQNTTNPEILWGDANHDGTVDISDVVLMNRVYVGVDQVTTQGLTNADVDQSGKIELSDSMNVLKLLVHLLELDNFPIS
ncbi:MAG: leucine-rich repeat protein [Oscillospiraceae bacterium]|nr:leucine-rich repeat protein [Oscillospiraceae bacterium]